MKKHLYIFFVLCCFSTLLFSQNQQSIIDDLNAAKWGQGSIKVMQDESIQGIVATYHGNKLAGDSTRTTGGTTKTPSAGQSQSPSQTTTQTNTPSTPQSVNNPKFKGYKIQVFMGNDQQKSRREAEWKQSQIKGIYPELPTEISYSSPFFKLRVGNFRSREEAQEALNDMRKTFPSFGREMIIIRP